MENLGLVSSPKIVLGVSPNPRNSPISVSSKQFVGLPNLLRRTGKSGRRSNPTPSLSVVSLFGARKATKTIGNSIQSLLSVYGLFDSRDKDATFLFLKQS